MGPKWAVWWNSQDSCGILEEIFDSEEEARQAGLDWQRKMEWENPNNGVSYTFEVEEER